MINKGTLFLLAFAAVWTPITYWGVRKLWQRKRTDSAGGHAKIARAWVMGYSTLFSLLMAPRMDLPFSYPAKAAYIFILVLPMSAWVGVAYVSVMRKG
jgi:hypothetical protein